MVAVDNTFNGLVGLLQLPLTDWGLRGLRGNFLAINLIQVWGILGLIKIGCIHYDAATNRYRKINQFNFSPACYQNISRD